jgi:hypothetical protein
MRGVLLQFFPFLLRQPLVIRHLGNQFRDIRPERIRNETIGDLAVLDGVVKQRGNDQIEVLAVRRFGDEGGDLKQMVGVRLLRGALAPLVDMPSRRGIGRLQNHDPAFHCAASSRNRPRCRSRLIGIRSFAQPPVSLAGVREVLPLSMPATCPPPRQDRYRWGDRPQGPRLPARWRAAPPVGPSRHAGEIVRDRRRHRRSMLSRIARRTRTQNRASRTHKPGKSPATGSRR